MDTSITQVVRLTGISSRTLRHYQAVGLLEPSRIGHGGTRYYDQRALARLQRILLLRQLGVGLPAIAAALDNGPDDTTALQVHLDLLHTERQRLDRQIAAVARTIAAREKGTQMTAEDMLDGFDHTRYRDEVTARWGADTYARSDQWWRGLGAEGQREMLAESKELARAWQEAAAKALPVDDPDVQALAQRHCAWIAKGWGGVAPTPEQLAGLAQMYVDDERFAANYGGAVGAAFVRDALLANLG